MVYAYSGNGVDSKGVTGEKEQCRRFKVRLGPRAWVQISALQNTRIIKLLRAGVIAQSKALHLVPNTSYLEVEKKQCI